MTAIELVLDGDPIEEPKKEEALITTDSVLAQVEELSPEDFDDDLETLEEL